MVLIDDVLTTGATVGACARVLRRAGASRVDVLTLARVVRDTPGPRRPHMIDCVAAARPARKRARRRWPGRDLHHALCPYCWRAKSLLGTKASRSPRSISGASGAPRRDGLARRRPDHGTAGLRRWPRSRRGGRAVALETTGELDAILGFHCAPPERSAATGSCRRAAPEPSCKTAQLLTAGIDDLVRFALQGRPRLRSLVPRRRGL